MFLFAPPSKMGLRSSPSCCSTTENVRTFGDSRLLPLLLLDGLSKSRCRKMRSSSDSVSGSEGFLCSRAVSKPPGPTVKSGPTFGMGSMVRIELLEVPFDEEILGMDAERLDLEISEEEIVEQAVFCLTGKQRSSLSVIDFGVRDMVEELDGEGTSETACTKLDFPV